MAKKRRTIDGLPVFDSTTGLVFKVTPVDIKTSKRKSCEMCAASVAICRTLKAKEARVYLSRTLVRRPDRWDRYATPGALRTEIVCFDRTGDFRPGEFRLGAPCASQKLGYTDGKKRSPHKKNGKPARAMHIVEGVRPVMSKGAYSEKPAD
jgi:hypothetical protein